MENRTKYILGGVGGAVVLTLILLFLSIGTLEYTELGLHFSLLSYDVKDTKGFTRGLHLLGVGNYFIKFPGEVQTIQFSQEANSNGPLLRSRTQDGLEVQLEVSFQFRLNKDDVYKVYKEFGMEYEKVYTLIAIDELTMQATLFNASLFFQDRDLVSERVFDGLKKVFKEQAYCDVTSFQLRSVALPSEFEDAIQETEVMRQDNATAYAERLNQEVAAITELKTANQTALSINLNADAQAERVTLEVEAFEKYFLYSQELQSEGFKLLYPELDSREDLLLDYLNIRALRDHPSAKSMVRIAGHR